MELHSVKTTLISELSSAMQNTIRDMIKQTVLPGLQSMISESIRQLASELSQAIVDSSFRNQPSMDLIIATIQRDLEDLRIKLSSIPTTAEICSLLKDFNIQNTNASDSCLETSSTHTRERIQALINSGANMQALIEVLEQGNLQLLEWSLNILDITALAPSMPPQVALSLIQQITHDLSSLAEIKLQWLSEVMAEFDARSLQDPELIQTSVTVLTEAATNLKTQLDETPPNSSIYKQLKLVLRLVRAAI